MRSLRPRPRCRAHNTFSPSIALWQHFIAPNEHLLRLQLRSPFATEAAQFIHPSTQDETLQPNLTSNSPKIRKLRTAKGDWRPSGEQKQHLNGHTPKPHQDAEQLLVDAKKAYDTAQDYEGVVVRPMHTNGAFVKENNLPWVPVNRQHVKAAEERLELEIQAFHEYMRPNQAERLARKHVVEQVRQHVQEILPGYILEVFGSERTGIAFAGSDIDLRLIPKDVISNTAHAKLPPTPEERYKRREDLRRLHRVLVMKHRGTYLLSTIRWSRYPLISLQDKASGLDIQLVLSNDTSHSRELMQRYMTEYSFLPQLYSVIKATLDIRGLSDVFRGGAGSYALFMIIVASLKHKPHQRNDAGGNLAYFMRFWRLFKSEEHGVSIEPAELFDKHEQVVMHAKAMGHIEKGSTPPLPKWMLTLRDPADDTNDLGRKIIAWKHIRTTLRYLDEKLHKDLKANTRPSLLATLVGPIYLLQQRRRRKLTEYGNYVVAEGSKTVVIGLAEKFMEYRRAQVAIEEQTAAARLVGTEASDEVAKPTATRQTSTFEELAVIAQAVREGETANGPSARKAEAFAIAREARKSEEDGTNPWLKEITEESNNRKTQQSFRSTG